MEKKGAVEKVRASDVRMVYQNLRGLGSRYNADRWKTHWAKIATCVSEMGVNLESFMVAQFAHVKPYPFPNQLYGSKARDRYNAWVAVTGDDILRDAKLHLVSATEFIETRTALGWTVGELLRDTTSPLSPLFRFAFACYTGQFEIAVEWEELAHNQYRVIPRVGELYGCMLPERWPEIKFRGRVGF